MKRSPRPHLKQMLPSIDIVDAKSSYFIYGNKVHRVANAPDAAFRAAVLALAPTWRSCPEYASLLKKDLDICVRWYLLCCLADSHRPMKLYPSRESAEQACTALPLLVSAPR